MNDAPQPSPNALTRGDLALLAAAALITIGFRLHANAAPLESDECNYVYFAQRMLAGDRLYVDVWDHQPPGIFALLVLPTALCGSSPLVYRTLALVFVLLTMVGIFDIARRWFGRPAAWAAILLFAAASSDPGIAGDGCNREIHMNALLVAAVWMLARRHTANLWCVLVAGLLIGLASTIKTIVALHWLALLPVVVMLPVPDGADRRRHLLRSIGVFAVGPAVAWLIVLAYFAVSGRFAEFVDAVFAQNLIYSGEGMGWGRRLLAFFLKGDGFRMGVFGSASALWLAGAFGLVMFPWRGDRVRSTALAGWVVGSYLAVCSTGKFWPHYYMLMLPPVVLLAAALVHRIETCNRKLSLGAALVILFSLLATQIPGYLLVEPDRIAQGRYGDRMSWVRDQAERVAGATDLNDSIYVWSTDAGFYYYSGRPCATRFTMNGALLGESESAYARRRLLVRDLAGNQPRLILIPFGRHPPCAELLEFIQERRYISVGRTERMEILCDPERPIERINWSWKTGIRAWVPGTEPRP